MIELINQFFRGTEDIIDSLEEFISEIAEEMDDDTVKEHMIEESKLVTKTVDDMKDTEVIFPRKVKSKFVAKKPASWEQNVQNLKNKNLKKK